MLNSIRAYNITAYSIPTPKNNEENQKCKRKRNKYGLIHHIQKILYKYKKNAPTATIEALPEDHQCIKSLIEAL